MRELAKLHSGRKTYLVALAIGLYSALIAAGLTDSRDEVWGLLLALGGATMRAGISKARFTPSTRPPGPSTSPAAAASSPRYTGFFSPKNK